MYSLTCSYLGRVHQIPPWASQRQLNAEQRGEQKHWQQQQHPAQLEVAAEVWSTFWCSDELSMFVLSK